MNRKTREKQTTLQIAMTIVGLVLCIILGLLLICNITIIAKGTLHPERPPSVLGVTPMVTLSDSMAGNEKDSFAAGDLIFVRQIEPEKLRSGDIIAFMEGAIVVSHRIVEVQTGADGSIRWITKGDANNTEDTNPVSEDALVGKYILHIPRLGSFSLFMQTPLGMIVFIGIPLMAFIIYDIIRRQLFADRERKKNAAMMSELRRLRSLEAQVNGQGEAETDTEKKD